MKHRAILCHSICIGVLFYAGVSLGRSMHRPIDPEMPVIEVQWGDKPHKFSLHHYRLTEYPLFNTFDYEHVQKNLLPHHIIPYRYESEKNVAGTMLDTLLNDLAKILDTLHTRHRFELEHFTILTQRNFNPRSGAGALIVKFKDYPFVVKIFRETPQSFVHPFNKGLEPLTFFNMGGGTTRHLAGFTRIKNLEIIQQLVKNSPEWRDRIDFPRKWYWLPRNPRWLLITGKNIGKEDTHTIRLPSCYAIVEDAIAIERPFSMHAPEDRTITLAFNHLHKGRLDLNIENYVYEKGTGKIILYDTEFFPVIVGDQFEVSSYPQWYYKLGMRYLDTTYLTTKNGYTKLQHTKPIRIEDALA